MEPQYVYRTVMLPAEKQLRMDGDTYWMDVDLGMRAHGHWKIRLHDYSCPERRDPGGQEAWEFAIGKLYATTLITIRTYKDRLSYDRWVADIWLDGLAFGPLLQAEGHATFTPM